jgi:hypothetical protein
MRARETAWLVLIAVSAFAATAAAQSGNGAARNGQGANGAKNGGSGTPPYEDVLIDGGRLAPDIWIGEVPEHDASGPPRGLRVDGIYSRLDRDSDSLTRYGIGIGAFLATPLYGAWSFDGVFGRSEDATVATLWQRDVPFDGGWRASNGLGNLNSPSIDLARFQPRWYLPTSPMLGGLTEWRDPADRQVTAGVGEPGVYTGLYVPGFRRLGGTLATVGGQTTIDRNWSAGLQYTGAKDVTSVLQPRDGAREFSTHSWFGAAA